MIRNPLDLLKLINRTHLSQNFGVSGVRLRNMIMTPIPGEILRITNCGGSCFAGAINSAGSGGLTATNVPYDGDTEENMFNGLRAYDGTLYWGHIILHNTTRGNTREIVSVDIANNAITTTSSTDDWADNDVLKCESQTNVGTGAFEYFDIELSDKIGTEVDAIVTQAVFQNNTANANTNNQLAIHPFASYNTGARQWCKCAVGNECTNLLMILPVTSQKITVCAYKEGVDDFYLILSVVGTVEFADT